MFLNCLVYEGVESHMSTLSSTLLFPSQPNTRTIGQLNSRQVFKGRGRETSEHFIKLV